MLAGLPALIVLAGTIVLGACLAALLTAGTVAQNNRSLHFLFVTQLVVAPTFWAWALYNCVYKNFDLGVVSFAFVTVASAYGFVRLDVSSPDVLLNQRTVTGLSGALVVFNYAVGIIVGVKSSWTLAIYMSVACLAWALATVYGVRQLKTAASRVATQVEHRLVDEAP